MPDRRYTDDEVAEIFRRATDSSAAAAAAQARHADRGLSLAELQEIGREVGIAPETVTAAARSIEHIEPVAAVKVLGLPIGVRHTVELERRISDEEWDQLVVVARDTFAARGTLGTAGAFRQWTNGNLQVLLEPTANGSRLRMGTTHGESRRVIPVLAAVVGGAALVVAGGAFGGWEWAEQRMNDAAGFGALALFMLGYYGVRLPRWATRRQAQFRELAERLLR